MTLCILVLAAGGSTRMGPGRDKLLEQIAGKPLLQVVLDRALACHTPVYVTLPALDHPRHRTVPDGVHTCLVADWADGMSASIRAGIEALPAGCSDVMILPADMPDLTSSDLLTLIKAHRPTTITRGASADGTPGHPVIFPQSCFDALSRVSGDEGGRSVVKSFAGPITLIPLSGDQALVDLDTPEAWAKWRSQTS